MTIGQSSFAKVCMVVTRDSVLNEAVLSAFPSASQSTQSSGFVPCVHSVRPTGNACSSTSYDA